MPHSTQSLSVFILYMLTPFFPLKMYSYLLICILTNACKYVDMRLYACLYMYTYIKKLEKWDLYLNRHIHFQGFS